MDSSLSVQYIRHKVSRTASKKSKTSFDSQKGKAKRNPCKKIQMRTLHHSINVIYRILMKLTISVYHKDFGFYLLHGTVFHAGRKSRPTVVKKILVGG